MSPSIEIANYRVAQTPKEFQYAVKNFIFMRRHKQITIQKPMLDLNATDKDWYDPDKHNKSLNFFKTEEEEQQEKLLKNKVLVNKPLQNLALKQFRKLHEQKTIKNNYDKANKQQTKKLDLEQLNAKKIHNDILVKRKMIQRAGKLSPNQEKQRKVQKMYCKYLLNALHKSNLLLIHRNIPPNLSVLETIQDGDYLKNGQRKDYPHYSNAIQPIDLPAAMSQKTKIIRQPVRMDPRQFFFSVEDNTVFKVKHVSLLLDKLFEQSIKNCSMIREMNFKGDQSLRLENENHNFEKLAEMIGVNFRTAKMLFDMLNDHYDLEKELALGRSDDYKTKVCKELVELLEKEIREFFDRKKSLKQSTSYSCFIPMEEYFLSLKDLGEIFIEVHNKAK